MLATTIVISNFLLTPPLLAGAKNKILSARRV
jgi:hypothetical protein